MLTNSIFNRKVIRKIALALGELNERVIFVGGATIGMYANDPAAEDVRATKDVDITVEIASFVELESIREELVQKGRCNGYESCRMGTGQSMVRSRICSKRSR